MRVIIKKIALLALVAVLLPLSVFGQGISSDGREYFLGMLYPSFNAAPRVVYNIDMTAYYTVSALVSAETGCVVKLFYYDSTGHESLGGVYSLAAHSSVQVYLDTSKIKITPPSAEQPLYRACHIVSTAPVAVHFFSYGACSGGEYLAIPIECWGKQYVVESYQDNVGGIGGVLSNETSAGCFEVIASQDSTIITITPTTTTSMGHIGARCGTGSNGTPHPFTITLDRGQCYLVRSEALDPNENISGTIVLSNKPVAVIGGHENAITDGSDVSPGGTRPLEARNFMIQQMLPVEIWDSTGYFSIPFVGSKPPIPGIGVGDEYDFFSAVNPQLQPSSPKGSNMEFGNSVDFIQALTCNTSPIIDYTNPIAARSADGTRVQVVEYDQREQGSGPPYPAPAEMCLIPQSLWKRDYLFNVPKNNVQNLQGYFINLICIDSDFSKGKIKVGVNGGKGSPISGLVPEGKFNFNSTGTTQSHLMGIQFLIYIGSYYIYGDSDTSPFTVYNYGDRAFDPDNDLGDFDNEDMFFSYADPTGFLYKQFGAITPKLSAVVTNKNCNAWTVCVSDSGDLNTGIRYIELLNYQNKELPSQTSLAKNIRFDRSLDPQGKGDLILPGTDKQYCFTVYSDNVQDSSQFSVAVYDNSGTALILSAAPTGPVTNISSSGSIRQDSASEYSFVPVSVDTVLCGSIVLHGGANGDSSSFEIDSVYFLNKNSGALVTLNTPKFPVTLHSGDSSVLNICFNSKGVYHAVDSLVIVSTSCGAPYYLTVVGQVISGQILAPDLSFGSVFEHDTLCKTIQLTNTGSAPLELKGYTISDTLDFSASSPLFQYLPITLDSGKSLDVTVCFHPQTDSLYNAQILWQTDIAPGFLGASKFSTNLNGVGGAFDITWLETRSAIIADSNARPVLTIQRYYLHNRTNQSASVLDTHLNGNGSNEFTISNSQSGTSNIVIPANDSVWFDIAFVPDVSKPYPDRYEDRTTDLVAVYQPTPKEAADDSAILHITGTFDQNFQFGAASVQSGSFLMSGFIYGNSLILNVPSDQHIQTIKLYDLLGRTVSSWNAVSSQNSRVILMLPPLPSGMYVVRLMDDASSLSCKVMKN